MIENNWWELYRPLFLRSTETNFGIALRQRKMQFGPMCHLVDWFPVKSESRYKTLRLLCLS
jgi:hypothetical protein